jgi:hypothetical protein
LSIIEEECAMACAPQGAFNCTLGSPVVGAADHQDPHSRLLGRKLASVLTSPTTVLKTCGEL